MDQHPKNEEEIIQKWMNEVGLETPSPSFTDRIMQAVEQKTAQKTVYKPLISKKGWFVVAAIFVLSMGWLYFYPMGEISYLNELPQVQSPDFKNPFSDIKISRSALYAIGMLALFLIQLPFLKSLINRQYSE